MLDIDSQRRLLGQYREDYQSNYAESYGITQRMCLAMAQSVLNDGQDVVVDKMQRDPEWHGKWVGLGKHTGAEVYEFMIWASKATVLARADARGYTPGAFFTREKVVEFWEDLNRFKETLPNLRLIDNENLSKEAVAQEIMRQIGFPRSISS